jgi:hypothetical protein
LFSHHARVYPANSLTEASQSRNPEDMILSWLI